MGGMREFRSIVEGESERKVERIVTDGLLRVWDEKKFFTIDPMTCCGDLTVLMKGRTKSPCVFSA